MVDRGVDPCKTNVATAAELGGFMYFLGGERMMLEAFEGDAA